MDSSLVGLPLSSQALPEEYCTLTQNGFVKDILAADLARLSDRDAWTGWTSLQPRSRPDTRSSESYSGLSRNTDSKHGL
jgi:hypothetical protein